LDFQESLVVSVFQEVLADHEAKIDSGDGDHDNYEAHARALLVGVTSKVRELEQVVIGNLDHNFIEHIKPHLRLEIVGAHFKVIDKVKGLEEN